MLQAPGLLFFEQVSDVNEHVLLRLDLEALEASMF